ncbi:Mu transposase C-terminal domain-containing protein [Phormidium tenue]|uniref:Transposase n=1 Tax=Phormidium tenue NIES-30 TaxID=549789 RepID=A0A1U7IZ99_9CYAN|nr:Mu transposase C-terminal domain-containing protein [Phormidium tenue]MBD2234597.1 Mu transposase C-terminal domain-containing protein [Phormidium tenue FACHB-1052]OKH44211.1 transposase [Phormidium tenue NIES-30]
MSERQVEDSLTYQNLDEVSLGETAFGTDPFQVVIESSDPHKLRYRLIEWLAASPNRKIKSERKTKVAETLKLNIRQVERLLKQYFDGELQEDTGIVRSDKGSRRINEYWQNKIQEIYKDSLKDKHPLKPADVVGEVRRHAEVDLGLKHGDYPHPATIYRILNPLIEQQRRNKKIRNPGSGSWLVVETRDGQSLRANFSNEIVQCDHTKLDIRIIDQDGKTLQWRPWLTIVVDTFSGCLIGYHLWHKQPGSHEVGLTLRVAILPKQFPPEYELEKPWNVYGPPLKYFFTDGGKDLSSSKHIKSIGRKLGFLCELRDRPNQGGIVERLFKTINTQVLEALPGYQPSRPKKEEIEKAEKEACLNIDDLDRILASYFCDDYNHHAYPKDPRETRYERWFRGMGNKLPEHLDERELDLLLMNEVEVTVQANGSFYFRNIIFRCEELKAFKGKFVSLRYDPDHALTMFVYDQVLKDTFIGYAHAINMDNQDLSLYDIDEINKKRNSKKRDRSNYSALVALGKRKELVNERKQDKKDRQQSEQKKLRTKGKGNSEVAKQREEQKAKANISLASVEVLPERIDLTQVKQAHDATTTSQNIEPPIPPSNMVDRHQLVVPKNRNVRKLY